MRGWPLFLTMTVVLIVAVAAAVWLHSWLYERGKRAQRAASRLARQNAKPPEARDTAEPQPAPTHPQAAVDTASAAAVVSASHPVPHAAPSIAKPPAPQRRGLSPHEPRPQAFDPETLTFEWLIDYVDGHGATTRRRIYFDKVQDLNGRVVAYCSLRQAERTFYFDSCTAITDMRTGRDIVDLAADPPIDDLQQWLQDYRRWRRGRAPKP